MLKMESSRLHRSLLGTRRNYRTIISYRRPPDDDDGRTVFQRQLSIVSADNLPCFRSHRGKPRTRDSRYGWTKKMGSRPLADLFCAQPGDMTIFSMFLAMFTYTRFLPLGG